MNKIATVDRKEKTLNSREVAKMIRRKHSELLKDIRRYSDYLAAGDFPLGRYFMKSSYIDANNQERPCFLVTKAGCEIIANKLTGKHGTWFTAAYVDKFNQMEHRQANINVKYQIPQSFAEALRLAADVAEQNSQLRADNEIKTQKIAEYEPKITYLDQILKSPATLTVTQIAADYGMSARALNEFLHRKRIQHKVNGQWILYRVNMRKGWTKSLTHQFQRSDGRLDTALQTRWTQKGRLAIHQLLESEGIQALIDREE